MKVDELIRNYGFWVKDFTTGNQLNKYYKDIKKAYQEGVSEKEINKKISKLLTHATDTTDFYNEYKGITDIANMPVVNKMIYKTQYDKFISDKYIDNKSNRTMSTSGSTGTPFTIIQDKDKVKRCHAAVVFFGELAGYKIGMKQAAFRIWTSKVKKNPISAYIQNLEMIDISEMNDNKLEEIISLLENKKVKSILAYASALTALSKYIEQNNREIKGSNIRSIISCAEMLYEDTQSKLKDYFKCPVVSRYVNMENGIMGQQYCENNTYYIDASSYYIEILKLDSDEPVIEGEVGRVVVTDLYNYAFPVIRYDTGDTAIMKKRIMQNGNKIIVFEQLYGRRVDIIYDCEGRPLSPHVITNNMWGIEGVKQFKFIQTQKEEYQVLINTNLEEFKNDFLITKFREILGQNAQISIKIIEEIPVLASGKRKYIENTCKEYQ